MGTAIRKSCGLSQFIALAQKYRLIYFNADNIVFIGLLMLPFAVQIILG
jgi:hypothetical protein